MNKLGIPNARSKLSVACSNIRPTFFSILSRAPQAGFTNGPAPLFVFNEKLKQNSSKGCLINGRI
jgi:hypothetical protein